MRIEVPAARLAAPTTDDQALKEARRRMREALLRGEPVEVRDGGQMSVPSQRNNQPTAQQPAIVVPPGKLAAPANDDEALKEARRKMREALLRGESVVVRDGGQLAQPTGGQADRPSAQQPAIVVPPGKLAAPSMFWY